MGLLFEDDLHDRLGTWPLAYIPYGGADFGEVLAAARAVGKGDDGAYFEAWNTAADRLMAEAQEALALGRRATARDLLFRASAFYATAYHPLYGAAVDRRLRAAHANQTRAFDQAMGMLEAQATPLSIPFERWWLPGYFIPAATRPMSLRPLVIFINGYDGTMSDVYFASVVATSQRGYHCLIFDGPGQGSMLVQGSAKMRPDWEAVIDAVLNVALTLPVVDAKRIAVAGWGLGGHLALRTAAQDERIAACIADPGVWSMADPVRDIATQLGVEPHEVDDLANLAPDVLELLDSSIDFDRTLTWMIKRRGFWVHGVATLKDYLAEISKFTLDGIAHRIVCPTLLTQAQNDPLAKTAEAVFERIRGPKTLMPFDAIDGAGDPCEMGNRSLLNRRVLDWIDEVFAY